MRKQQSNGFAHKCFIIFIFQNGVSNCITLGINKFLSKYKIGPEAVILNISPDSGIQGPAWYPLNSGTKSAVIGFTKCWGQEKIYEKTKVRVLGLCPGATNISLMDEILGRTLPVSPHKPTQEDPYNIQE